MCIPNSVFAALDYLLRNSEGDPSTILGHIIALKEVQQAPRSDWPTPCTDVAQPIPFPPRPVVLPEPLAPVGTAWVEKSERFPEGD